VNTVQSDAVIRTLESDNLHLVNSIETLESQYSSLNGQLDELRETNVDEMKTMKLLLSDKDKEMKLMIEKSYHEAEELRRKLDLQQSDSQRILQEKLALADKVFVAFVLHHHEILSTIITGKHSFMGIFFAKISTRNHRSHLSAE